MENVSRRDFVRIAGALGAALGMIPISACATNNTLQAVEPPTPADLARLKNWVERLRPANGLPGWTAARAGELAIGTPYEAFTLEQYLKEGGDPSKKEPLALSLTRFDCVTLVEACLAVARLASKGGGPEWPRFAREVEKMRYRGGIRNGFASRLHYFSEWISDGETRGLVHDMGKALGGTIDARPLRFMTEHRGSYPGLKDDSVFRAVGEMERSLDSRPRYLIPTDRIAAVADRIQSGDVLAFATSIPGLDVSHAAFAYRDKDRVLRVLHAPLSGGSVEITARTLSDYVSAIKRSTGILVARPLG